MTILSWLIRGDSAAYRSEFDLWRSSGVGVDLKERKRVAEFCGVKL